MAPYAFRIHEPAHTGPGVAAPVSATNMSGWTQTSHIAGGLLENIEVGIADKMGTSIPSIFARLFLFNGAFQTLQNKAFRDLQLITPDTILVSECLDMIEFLFQHGQDPKLVVRHWNRTQQTAALRATTIAGHKKLAQVIDDEVGLNPLLEDIYLFYWVDATPSSLTPREFLIGGTSPYTLAFTSPNWKRIISENRFSFQRLDGTTLFGDSVESLSMRDTSFKSMLYALYHAYAMTLMPQAPFFNSYLQTMWDGDQPQDAMIAAMGGNPAAFVERYKPIHDDKGANVMAGGLPMSYEPVTVASGYEMRPTANRWATYTAADGTLVNIHTPLALNDNGLGPGVKYVGHSAWTAAECKINEAELRGQQMHERQLPGGMGVKYPCLFWFDILEDKIIKLPYTINGQRFVTAFSGDSQYVLPLKREFFKYFNVDDIGSMVHITQDGGGQKVKVIIDVPIKDPTHRTIQFAHEYSGDNIVSANILLGFFPFYKCNVAKLNRYNVMSCGAGYSLAFYCQDDLAHRISSPAVIRTPQQNITQQTEYHAVNQTFDFVEVSVGSKRGVIVPQLTHITVPTDGGNAYKFAVDFGTSNTYIAHTTSAGGLSAETFEIDAHDQQTVFMNKPDKDGNVFTQASLGTTFYLMYAFFAREFAPVALTPDSPFAYPIKTATCETINFEKNPATLFGTVSIGFNMMNEPQQGSFRYKTGLKWLLEQHPGDINHTNRVKNFFLQTLWMMKNESLLNGGDDAFELYVTYPETMKIPAKMALASLWDQAKLDLGINCQILDFRSEDGHLYSESVAPYNCMAASIGGSSYLNVDIGGGTNDLLFVNKNEFGVIQSAHFASAMFAGDDLWGDGISVGAGGGMANGFADYVFGLVSASPQQYPQPLMASLNALKGGVTSSSADVMGYLFKHDAVFLTSQKLMGQPVLHSLVFIHYAALMYHVARLIKKMGIDIPEKLSFTGMGSKYLNLISTDQNTLKRLTVLLLEKYSERKVSPAFAIIKPAGDVKEVTAKGVLAGLGLSHNFAIPAGALTPVVDYGFDTGGRLTYDDIRTQDVRTALLQEFNRFVDTLAETDVTNFLFSTFGLRISSLLLKDLKTKAIGSFTTCAAAVDVSYGPLDVTETLFFWPLKNALVELSKNYALYNN